MSARRQAYITQTNKKSSGPKTPQAEAPQLESHIQNVDLLGAIQHTIVTPAALKPSDILALQRSVGNQTVQRLLTPKARPAAKRRSPTPHLIQAKLAPCSLGDRYEQEADQAAEAAITRSTATPTNLNRQPTLSYLAVPIIQRVLNVGSEPYTPEEAWEELSRHHKLDISESGAIRVLHEWEEDDQDYDNLDELAEYLENAGYNYEIGGEMVYIELRGNNEEEQKQRAADIMMAITLTYGMNFGSDLTAGAIRKSLELNRPEIGEREYRSRIRKLNQDLEPDSWTLEDLEAMLAALGKFGNILGRKRASSPRADIPQEITTLGKFTEAVDFKDTLAETFQESGHIALYEEGVTETGETPAKEDKTQTLIHEFVHGLLEHRLEDFKQVVPGYVKGEFEDEKLPHPGVTGQGVHEDFAESAAMYLYGGESREELRDNHPIRYGIVEKIVKEEMGDSS